MGTATARLEEPVAKRRCAGCGHTLRQKNAHGLGLCWLCQRDLNAHGPNWGNSKKLQAWADEDFPIRGARCVVCDTLVSLDDLAAQEGRCDHDYQTLQHRRQNIVQANRVLAKTRKSGRKAVKGDFPVEKGIKIPDERGRHPIYPWRELKVGDSFFIPGKTTTKVSGVRFAAGKRLGISLVTRREGTGVRIWRVK